MILFLFYGQLSAYFKPVSVPFPLIHDLPNHSWGDFLSFKIQY